MGAHVRQLILLSLTAALAALAWSAPAWAATGTVLTIEHGRTVELIRGDHVDGYRYGRAAALAVGSRIHFDLARGRLRAVRPAGRRARLLSFTGTVVSYGGSGLVLKLGDGAVVRFGSRRVERACASSLPQLQVGQRVRVREQLAGGGYQLVLRTIAGKPACASTGTTGTVGGTGAPPRSSIQRADGVVSEIDTNDIVVQESDGPSLTLNAPSDAIQSLTDSGDLSLAPCENVSVSYNQTSAGLELDGLQITGQSLVGCVEGDGVSLLVVGTLESIGSSSFTLDVPGVGTLTLGQDPSDGNTDGLNVGDLVLATYTVNSDGSLTSVDASDDPLYTTGTVTEIDNNGGDVKDWTTGAIERFVDDNAGFENTSTSDAVAVAYYRSATGLLTENLDDLTNDTTG